MEREGELLHSEGTGQERGQIALKGLLINL
jgi:hypothetical protein